MKPGEFDDLIRHRFDQGDFAYNPRNWDKMAEKLEGQTKKRGILVWWLPLVGVAAAVTMSMGFVTYMQHAAPLLPANDQAGRVATVIETRAADVQMNIVEENHPQKNTKVFASITKFKKNQQEIRQTALTEKEFSLSIENIRVDEHKFNYSAAKSNESGKQKNLVINESKPVAKKNRQIIEPVTAYQTFKETPKAKEAISSIILSGGVNYGNKNSGFMFGATGRRMINEKVYVEGDIALAGSNNIQKTAYMVNNGDYVNGRMGSSTRTSGDVSTPVVSGNTGSSIRVADQSYNMYYAQVTPSIGYKLLKRMSVGFGPDFQQVLSDNRPAPSTLDRGNVQVAPLFDIGFIGKTEFTLNGNLKAGIFYREGINNIITPMNKYIDRNYIQFQVKYAIFNKVK